jgi:predicted transcriptional regulator
MRTIFAFIILIMFHSCTEGVSQKTSEEMRKEAEFQEIMRKAKETSEANKKMMDSADKQAKQIVQKTSEQIVSLKQEVKQLKQELNETTINPSDGTKFKFLPIANDSKNRE